MTKARTLGHRTIAGIAAMHAQGQRRSFATVELPAQAVEAIASFRMSSEHDHLNMLLRDSPRPVSESGA